jgi:hypothetical protein
MVAPFSHRDQPEADQNKYPGQAAFSFLASSMVHRLMPERSTPTSRVLTLATSPSLGRLPFCTPSSIKPLKNENLQHIPDHGLRYSYDIEL